MGEKQWDHWTMSPDDTTHWRGPRPGDHEIEVLPYAAQIKAGFNWLRFRDDLEPSFRDWYWNRRQRQRHYSILVSSVLFLLFSVKDLLTLPQEVSFWTAGIRAIGINGTLLLALIASARCRRTVAERWLVLAGVVALYGLAAAQLYSQAAGAALPYEGLLVVVFAEFFMIGFRVPQALAITAPLALVYPLLASVMGAAVTNLTIQAIYILTAVGVGLVGSYAMEHYAREGYLSQKLARFRAERDPLTLLYNRSVAIDHLAHVWRIGCRDGSGVSALLIDVDYFKRYNDEYGHLAGDDCLRRVAAILQSTMKRPLDLIARYGGEEFIGIAYGMSQSDTQVLGESIRAALEASRIKHVGSPEAGIVTVSIGVAWVQPTPHGDFTQLIELADRAMYRAKSLGRNRVESAPLQRVSKPQRGEQTVDSHGA